MRDLIIDGLLKHGKQTVTMEELESFIPGNSLGYEEFAKLILELEGEGILEMVKAKGRNNRKPSLAFSYRIQKQQLKKELLEELKQYRLQLHPSIQLDAYFRLDPSQWKRDLPYLQSIHTYIESFGFPEYEVPAPERSVELVGDEKWITDKQGKELLERVGLWAQLKVIPVSDPLMFAVNPKMLSNPVQRHLIVENKTTYQALVVALPETTFSTLIYGSGNKIIKSINQFQHQLPISGASHTFHYFGDIDYSGLFIWHKLNEKQEVQPALPFYRACLNKPFLTGKITQRKDESALNAFLSFFSKSEQNKLARLLNNGHYYPQEVLKTSELQHIWRYSQWS